MLFSTLLSALFAKKAITILGVDIPKNISGITTFSILCAINFKFFHLLQNIKMSINILEPDTDIVLMRIRLHQWTLNPFYETEGKFSLFSDNFGYALLLLLWWLGAQTGFYLIRTGNKEPILIVIGIALFAIYLFLGLMSMFLISELISIICRNKASKKIKMILTVAAIPIGAFGLKAVFF